MGSVFLWEGCVFSGYNLPWEPATSSFRGCDPYFKGFKPSFFMVLGSSLSHFIICCLIVVVSRMGYYNNRYEIDGFIGFCWNPSDGCIFLGGSEK